MRNKERYFKIFLFSGFLMFIPLASLEAQSTPILVNLAEQYFHEARVICTEDSGKLWGVFLCGPMMFVDRNTRAVVTNQKDREGNLIQEGNIFVGKLPRQVNIANTAMEWAGVKWTMIVWPLPEDRDQRANLMVHEMWHRVQDEIGLPGSMPANNHLDSFEGRFWLQLEWRALRAALINRGAQRRRAMWDALVFRSYRRLLFPKAESEERALEMSEGLAEYTGVRLSGRHDLIPFIAEQLQAAEKTESFVRFFAYSSGPAYGILLDESGMNWRPHLTPQDDLGALLEKAYSIRPPRSISTAARHRLKEYDGFVLQASEEKREKDRQARLAQLRARFVKGPLLVVPLQKMNMQFNPSTLQPLDSLGTVYPEVRIVDVWGVLTVTKGALLSPAFDKMTLPAPIDTGLRPIRGDGWTLELNSGWAIVPGERKGDYVLKKE